MTTNGNIIHYIKVQFVHETFYISLRREEVGLRTETITLLNKVEETSPYFRLFPLANSYYIMQVWLRNNGIENKY